MRRTENTRLRTGLAALYILSCYALIGVGACLPQKTRVDAQAEALSTPGSVLGQQLFEEAPEGSNGRACATCHVADDGFTLKPASVEARLRDDPHDPLFNRLDADDPNAEEPTFEALRKGLVRVTLELPENMDVIDSEGRVTTPPDRTIFVWRGVPSVVDSALTAPFQMDGREATLQQQAQSAVSSHAEGPELSRFELDRIAQFQRNTFSSLRGRFVSMLTDLGVQDADIPVPEDYLQLTASEHRGREVYETACAGCHGGPTTSQIEDRRLHTFLSVALTPEGNVRFAAAEGGQPAPVNVERPDSDYLNAGFGAATYGGQIGLAPSFNASVPMPRYRFRFYTDDTRTQRRVDLPPVPRTVSGDPFDLRPQIDENGAPIVGPNLIPQAFTTDPGRAAITGDPADFEAFDMPQLRGIARTAPYFHDNSRETLRDVVDEYSRFLLPFLAPLGLPKLPPEQAGGRTEALTPDQKNDLLKFLERL